MRSLYDEIGGDAAVRRLVDTFYDLVETDPAGKIVHDLHLDGFGMGHVRAAQFEFLCGFLGGPKYYVERMGHSNLRKMHEHLAFGEPEAQAWLLCMGRAIDAAGFDDAVKQKLMRSFRVAAEVLLKDQTEAVGALRRRRSELEQI